MEPRRPFSVFQRTLLLLPRAKKSWNIMISLPIFKGSFVRRVVLVWCMVGIKLQTRQPLFCCNIPEQLRCASSTISEECTWFLSGYEADRWIVRMRGETSFKGRMLANGVRNLRQGVKRRATKKQGADSKLWASLALINLAKWTCQQEPRWVTIYSESTHAKGGTG